MDFFVGVAVRSVVCLVSALFGCGIGLRLACSAGTLCTLAAGTFAASAAGFSESHSHEACNQKYEARYNYFFHSSSKNCISGSRRSNHERRQAVGLISESLLIILILFQGFRILADCFPAGFFEGACFHGLPV